MPRQEAVKMDHALYQLAEVFRLLSDKTRLCILLALAEGERNVTALCRQLSLPQPTISHHLALLRLHRLVENRREGKQIFYSLGGPHNADGQTGFKFSVQDYVVQLASGGLEAVDRR